LKYDDGLFNYTRGRFVIDEAYEMSQRHILFNVNELGRVAAEAVGARMCVGIGKYPDGMYNKAMLLTMDDGNEGTYFAVKFLTTAVMTDRSCKDSESTLRSSSLHDCEQSRYNGLREYIKLLLRIYDLTTSRSAIF
jgi:hypothetical protein